MSLARPGAVAPGVSCYSEAVGAEIVLAVAAGRSLRAVCAEPGRPHRTTLAGWRRAHPEFDLAIREAGSRSRVGARMRDKQRRAEAAMATAETLASEGPPRRGGKASSYTKALGAAICARLEAGESLTSIGRREDMPCYGTILAWVKRHPAFEEMYVAARATQAEYPFDEARDVALAATRENVTASRLKFDVIRWQAARLAPKKYLERLVLADGVMEAKAAAKQEVVFSVTHFERGPNNTVLAAPPRNAVEAQAWVDATGAAYAPGIGPKGQMRPPPHRTFDLTG